MGSGRNVSPGILILYRILWTNITPVAGGGELSDSNIVAYLEDCMNNSGHQLVSEFRNMWPYTNQLTGEDYAYNKGKNLSWVGDDNNIETVFAIKFGTKGIE